MPSTRPINTTWNSERYNLFLEDINWFNLEDIDGVTLEWISWNRVNNIDTKYGDARSKNCYTWDTATFSWDSTEWTTLTWDDICEKIKTDYNTPRYSTFIEDLNWINILDINWNDLESINWNRTNRIDTIIKRW
jgi:hypothetical protein